VTPDSDDVAVPIVVSVPDLIPGELDTVLAATMASPCRGACSDHGDPPIR
jgi:hypothetical protein